ncbi:ATP-binding protein [Ornithinibacillus salinisoli]|uniref:Signal transduction histidine-protein kinase ArlS n=1 Tax=Ornithinibacillus salinisoli TaxID=1848459 RepID=A0ABW4W0X3_9BACI
MKLKTKIQLFSSLFMFVLILIINISVYFLFHQVSVDSELEELTSQTNTMLESLHENQDITQGELLKAFLPTDGMIRVIPEDGEALVHTKDKAYVDLPGEYVTKESKRIVSLDEGEFAVITKPIIWGDGEVVTLQVSKHLRTLTENMTVLLYVLVLASFIILIPTIVAGNVLSSFLLKPIQLLMQTMKENTAHNKWEKIEVNNRSKDELYEMEMAYNNMIDKLKENYEKQEIFVSDASHELKTPISIVKSYAQLMEKRGLDKPELFQESVQTINAEADRMHKLVEQMLSLAKNKEETGDEQIDIISLCKETIASFRGAYEREIQLQSSLDVLYVNGNTAQLKQILYILIDNGLKYSDNEVQVQISTEADEAILQVRDYGQGIPESDQLRIFDRFYRVDKARSRDTGGTGLGLAIAKAIAESHQGKLTLESTPGKGSTFILKLPI